MGGEWAERDGQVGGSGGGGEELPYAREEGEVAIYSLLVLIHFGLYARGSGRGDDTHNC